MEKRAFLLFLLLLSFYGIGSKVQAMKGFGPGIVFLPKNSVVECSIGACSADILASSYVRTPCGHVFCSDCLYKSLCRGSLCPICKNVLPITPEQLSMQFQYDDERVAEVSAGDAEVAQKLYAELNGVVGPADVGIPMVENIAHVPVPALGVAVHAPVPALEDVVDGVQFPDEGGPADSHYIDVRLDEIAQNIQTIFTLSPEQAREVISELASVLLSLEFQAGLLTSQQMDRFSTLRDVFASMQS